MDDTRALLAAGNDDDLEQLLVDLGESLDWPATPNLEWTSAIPDRHPTRLLERRSLWLAAAMLLITLGAALALSNGFRDAVAGFFGVRGIEIVLLRDQETTSNFGEEALSHITVGQPISLADAIANLPFTFSLPEILEGPDGLFLRDLPGDDQMVTAVYLPGSGIPETAGTGLGILLMQFTTQSDTPSLIKSLDPESGTLTAVEIDGSDGYVALGKHAVNDPVRSVRRSSRRDKPPERQCPDLAG